MTILSNGMELLIAINGIQLPLDHFAQPELQIDGSDETGLPILTALLVDNTGGQMIKNFCPIPDGALISITIANNDSSITREFRASACRPEGSVVALRGYANHPNYVIERSKSSINKTSQEALMELCDKCGLKFKGDVTADKMVWLPSGQRLINFARYIASASYVDEASMMVARISLDGEFRLRNLARAQTSIGLFGYSSGSIPIYGFRPDPNSTVNMHGGYKQTQSSSSMSSKSQFIEDMPLDVRDASLNRNDKLANLSVIGALKRIPIFHPRNAHDNYGRARYNNDRAKVLFSMTSKLLINNAFTNLDALDTITLSNSSKVDGTIDGTLATAYDGDWEISSKSLYVSNGQYFEMFRLMRMGLNTNMHGNTI